jgi:hypothetical protein
MEIGIDSFAAAYGDASLAVSGPDRLRDLAMKIAWAVSAAARGLRSCRYSIPAARSLPARGRSSPDQDPVDARFGYF